MRRAVLPCLVALLAASPALAEPWACTFTVECLATEGCDSTGFDAQLIAADHSGELFLSTMTGTSPITRLTATGAMPATYAGAGRRGLAELLTIEEDRTALLTVHMFDGTAAAITYFGTCEEMA